VTADTLEGYLDTLLRRLSSAAPGATWAKVFLPAASGHRYSGDALAQYALAQIALFGRPATRPEAGTVVLLGKPLTSAEAGSYVQGLGLEPYYVLFRRGASAGTPLMVGGPGGPGTPGGARDPITAALLQQLGANNIRDVPSGDYVVSVPGPDGVERKAQVTVTNANGSVSIRVVVRDGGGAAH
jgi:hypothetical protein